jgi:hypothetical protein
LLLFRLGGVVGSGVVTRKNADSAENAEDVENADNVENADDVGDANGIDPGVPREKQSRWKATASGEEEE